MSAILLFGEEYIIEIHVYVYISLQDEIPESVNCIAWLGSGDIVTGDANGNMMLWERDNTDAFNCKMVIDAHSVSVLS